MTKEEIVKEVAGATGVDRKEVAAIVESLMDSVKKSVAAGEPVYLRGFGTFSLKHRAAKPARNITAQTTILIPEKEVPHFKPCERFKNDVNKG
ncbi:MAG: integration host factor subunit beta [Bacteroidales bacterium]|jgi:DNA-binding protein HU-beta|nr:integration host factor subunit beta [Bacteroidales bacterium]MBO6238019.1 integration host factor subunit beta [Bacteroidales bacterium]